MDHNITAEDLGILMSTMSPSSSSQVEMKYKSWLRIIDMMCEKPQSVHDLCLYHMYM